MTRHRHRRQAFLWSSVLLVVVGCATSSSAMAHGPVMDLRGIGPQNKLFLSPGITLGGVRPTHERRRASFVLGGELSLLYVDPTRLWGGAYVDGIYGWDRRAGRLSVGRLNR